MLVTTFVGAVTGSRRSVPGWFAVLATVAAVAAALCLTGCASGMALGVAVTPAIVVDENPGGTPVTVGSATLDVTDAPKSGTVRIALYYYSKGTKKWQIVGRDSTKGHRWVDGDSVRLEVRYPCLTSGLKWRLVISWDGATADDRPDSGTLYYPSKRGVVVVC